MLSIAALIAVFLIYSYFNHISKLKEEEDLLVPPGQLVEVDGHDIHVVHEGNFESEYTLVFLHGNKTVDDSIALQPLFKQLPEYDLLYVDRSGVGYSDNADVSKKIDCMVEETRQAIKKVSGKNKYILVPTKSAGIMAIYWAKTYPDEIQSIIGLEMYFPEQYLDLADNEYSKFSDKIAVWLMKMGAQRFAKVVVPKDAFSVYTEKQMEIRTALVEKGFYTSGMYEEDAQIVKNAKKVHELGWPENIDMYLLYANPFMDPYLHLDQKTLDIYEEIAKQGEEYDCAKSYNSSYREMLKNYKNVTIEEISGPERMITYNPSNIADKIRQYLDNLK